MLSYWFDFMIEIMGAAVGAGIGGLISFKIAKYTLRKETKKDIAPLLLVLHQNRRMIRDISAKVNALEENILNDDESQEIRKIIYSQDSLLLSANSLWEDKKSVVFTECGEIAFKEINFIVNLIDKIVYIQSERKSHYETIANIKIACEKMNCLFNSITNKEIRKKLEIK